MLGAVVDGVSCQSGGIDLTGCIGRASVPPPSTQCRSVVCSGIRVGLLLMLMDMLAKDTAARCVGATGRHCTKRLPRLEDLFSFDDC